MTQINVPTVNENPDTISPVFGSEYAISFDAANPDGVPAHCQIGGPGVLGGPEYITLLQRGQLDLASTQTNGFSYETFELVQYPNHTFYSFKNHETGQKNVVAFLNGQAVVTDIVPEITVAPFATTLVTGLTATASSMPGTYTWVVSGGTITAGQGTNTITWTAGIAGDATFDCTFVNSLGVTAPAITQATCTVVAVPTVATIGGSATVTVGVSEQVTVVPQTGCTYSWVVSDGTITFGQGTPAMSYTPGTAGTNNVNCHVINQAGTSTAATEKVVTVVAAPTKPVITIGSPVAKNTPGLVASVPAQSGMTYLWTMSNGTIVDATLATISYTSKTTGGTNNVNCTVSNAATTPATSAADQVVQTVTP